jgi:hypothetical protein
MWKSSLTITLVSRQRRFFDFAGAQDDGNYLNWNLWNLWNFNFSNSNNSIDSSSGVFLYREADRDLRIERITGLGLHENATACSSPLITPHHFLHIFYEAGSADVGYAWEEDEMLADVRYACACARGAGAGAAGDRRAVYRARDRRRPAACLLYTQVSGADRRRHALDALLRSARRLRRSGRISGSVVQVLRA